MAKSTLNIGQELCSDSLKYRIEAVLGQGSFGIVSTKKVKIASSIASKLSRASSGLKSKIFLNTFVIPLKIFLIVDKTFLKISTVFEAIVFN